MNSIKILKPNLIIIGLTMGGFFGLFMGIVFGLTTTPFADGFNTGLSTGVFFGIAMIFSMRFQLSKHESIPKEIAAEGLLAHGPANHIKGGEGRGGWLYLTNSNLIFTPHKMNIQKEFLKIPLNQVVNYGESQTMGIMPNGLYVELPSGVKERFVVSQRAEWLDSTYQIIGKNKHNTTVGDSGSQERSPSTSNNAISDIAKLHELFKSGALTQDEYDAEKKKFLGKVS